MKSYSVSGWLKRPCLLESIPYGMPEEITIDMIVDKLLAVPSSSVKYQGRC